MCTFHFTVIFPLLALKSKPGLGNCNWVPGS